LLEVSSDVNGVDASIVSPCLSIILPVYNERESVVALVGRLRDLRRKAVLPATQVVFVDDHSSDNSPALLKSECQADKSLSYLRLSARSGSHVAIVAGLAHARGNCAVFLASDLQDPPELIPQMVDLWRKGHHIVWAVRQKREGISPIDALLARTFYFLLSKMGKVKLPPAGSDFALLDRAVVEALLQSVGPNPSLGIDIARLGFDQAQIPYTKLRRTSGHSKWSLTAKFNAFADAFVACSILPLRLPSFLGIALTLLDVVCLVTALALKTVGRLPQDSWTFAAASLLLVDGVILLMMGLSNEYLWRTLEASRRRPLYHIMDSLNIPRQDAGRVQSDMGESPL
jgi:dolichol-phosphate mannosyltransferase